MVKTFKLTIPKFRAILVTIKLLTPNISDLGSKIFSVTLMLNQGSAELNSKLNALKRTIKKLSNHFTL
jgi:hypothetical protein